jgi:hypothetical protein
MAGLATLDPPYTYWTGGKPSYPQLPDLGQYLSRKSLSATIHPNLRKLLRQHIAICINHGWTTLPTVD